MFREIVYQYAKVAVVVIALIIFIAFGDCIAETLRDFAGDY